MLKSSLQATVLAGLAVGAMTLSTTGAAAAAGVRFDAACTPLLTGFDRALYGKARESTDTLRYYMEVRRAILQQDVFETARWAERVAEAQKRCLGRLQVAQSATSSAAR